LEEKLLMQMKYEHLLFRNLLNFWGPKGQKQVGAAIN
jgi:hypothetical protein